MTPARQSLRGLELRPGYLDRADQEALLAAVREAIRQAPLYTPTMPRTGQPQFDAIGQICLSLPARRRAPCSTAGRGRSSPAPGGR